MAWTSVLVPVISSALGAGLAAVAVMLSRASGRVVVAGGEMLGPQPATRRRSEGEALSEAESEWLSPESHERSAHSKR